MIRGIVATSSLELGIDMGAVDRVICVESPGSVARGLQRVGRAGHQVGEISVGRIYPKFRGDLLESAVIAQRMRSAELESTSIPQNPLDVLAQQIVAMCCDTSRTVDEIEALVTRAYPFRNLSRGVLESVLDMVSGRYPSSEFADLRPWLRWDRATDVLSARRGAVMVSRMNPGTIPDRGHYAVHLGADGPRIGELDEEMVFESREGDVFLLGATSWRVEEITRDRVVVTPAPGEPGRLPFWKGEGPGRPVELGRAIGVFLQELGRVGEARAAQWLQSHTPLDPFAARNLAAYVFEQQAHAGCLPTDRTLCVERFRDELGDWRVCILTPFGARLHAPWAMALQRILSLRGGYETQLMYAEDGIVLRFADTDELPGLDVLIPDPDEIEDLITDQLPDTALFAGLFRENAARSLLLPRRRLTQRNPLWAQRLKSQALLASVRQYPSFPIVLETFRQALRDVFDLPALRQLLRDVRMRNVHVHQVETTSASPFARSLVFSYVAAYMYEQDAPLAERRAQALTLDRQLLGELLGQAELRELIDAGVLAELESELQHLPQDRKARDEDEVHDLLRRLGDLSEAEIRDRTVTDPGAWLRSLQRQRRVAAIEVAGESRWIAAEDAALFRDSLGVLPGADLPTAFLEPVENALLQLVRRHARHRGPFLAGDLTRRYGLSLAQIASSLRELERIGALVHGEVRPGGTELDWCDAEVLRQLKRRTLARLRNEVAPVDARTLGVFLPQWHGIGLADRRPDRLVESIAQLEGVALPWSEWNDTILPSRVLGFRPQMLDMLSATGEVVWVGRSPLGPKDGRVVLLLREHVGELLDRPPEGEALGEVQAAILTHLRQRGASFATEIESAVRQERSRLRTDEFTQAIWDLVWQGIVTNDTFGPLHALRAPQRAMRRSARGHALAGGRWSLVADLVSAEISPTQRALALSRLLLQRYGVVSREAAQAEELAGGFSAVYKVLRTMEEHGGIRRGYFVEGLTGAQFAHAGAVDLLRAGRPDPDGDETLGPGHVCVLPAVDPANPYGSLVAWPARTAEDAPPPRRMPGSWVVLVAGHPALYVGPRGRHLLTFPFPGRPLQDVLPLAVSAWLQAPHRHGRPILEKVDGQSVLDSPHLDVLRRCGFERGYRGLIRAGG